jgi:hypothetical protein
MARKHTPAPILAPLTIEIANAVKAAASTRGIDIVVAYVSAVHDLTPYDHIYLDSEGCRIVVDVGTGEIPILENPIPMNNYGKVMAYGYILQAPGVMCIERVHLKGKLELDYNKPEAKINGDLYVDMLEKAIKIKKTMEAAIDEEIC